MNNETVNEIITSLEGAGELSLREEKFLKLAKAYADQEVESVALALTFEKCREITNCPDGVDLQDHLRQLAAENVAIREQSEEVYAAGYNHGHLNTVDGIAYAGCVKDDFYGLALQVIAEAETPATDRIVAGIKADGRAEGINFAASRLAAAFNHGFVDKPMAEVGDVVRMILDAKADLANSPTPPEDGLSGEYAEKALAEWGFELREGAK